MYYEEDIPWDHVPLAEIPLPSIATNSLPLAVSIINMFRSCNILSMSRFSGLFCDPFEYFYEYHNNTRTGYDTCPPPLRISCLKRIFESIISLDLLLQFKLSCEPFSAAARKIYNVFHVTYPINTCGSSFL